MRTEMHFIMPATTNAWPLTPGRHFA